MSRSFLPWHRPISPALKGTLAVLLLLPRVSLSRSILLLTGTLLTAVLPVAITILSGELIGLIPEAVQAGIESSAGQMIVRFLMIIGVLIVVLRTLGPIQRAFADTFSRQVDRYLQERLMTVVSAPRGIGHLEDPTMLDLIRNAQGVGSEGLHPGDAVRAMASLIPSWLQALGSAMILLAFHWWLGLIWLALWPVILFVLQNEFVRVGQTSGTYAAVIRRADYFRDLALMPAAAKELRIWGLRDWLRDRYDASWLAAMQPIWKTRKPGRPIIWLTTGGVFAMNLGAFGLLAWAALRGDVSLAALAIYTRAILDSSTFRAFDDANAHLAYAAVSVPSLHELEQRLASQSPLVRPRD
ncbi:MAG: ABC transporter ATP-binding protein, partial [Candidatus Limnocylindrales bacterium]